MRKLGLRIAIAFLHPFNVFALCEADSYLKLVANSTALPETFNTTTAVSLLACGIQCHNIGQCVTVGYNAKSRECVLSGTTNVTQGTVLSIEPTGFKLFKIGL